MICNADCRDVVKVRLCFKAQAVAKLKKDVTSQHSEVCCSSCCFLCLLIARSPCHNWESLHFWLRSGCFYGQHFQLSAITDSPFQPVRSLSSMQRDCLTAGSRDVTPTSLWRSQWYIQLGRDLQSTRLVWRLATLNRKLKFVSAISTATSLAPPRVTAFLVAASYRGPTSVVPPSILEPSRACVVQDPHITRRLPIHLCKHADAQITVSIFPLVLQYGGVRTSDDTGEDDAPVFVSSADTRCFTLVLLAFEL